MAAHYTKAPLTEALIDVRVALPEGTELAQLAVVCDEEAERYPERQKHVSFVSELHINPEEVTSAAASQQKQTGLVVRSKDHLQVMQVRLDGFTFSRLAPYDRWETMRDEARRLWSLYRGVARPSAISRIAVRYINRVDLPLAGDAVDTKAYLRTGPEISPDLPQRLAGYFMQLQMPQEDLKSMLILTEATVPSNRPGVVSVLLDIDLFRELDVPQQENALWAMFEEFHDRKNVAFEASITDRLREVIR